MSVSRYMWTKNCEGRYCPGDCDGCNRPDEAIDEMCGSCVNAEYDYEEYFGGYKRGFVVGCKKDLEVEWNMEQECYECEGYKEVQDD